MAGKEWANLKQKVFLVSWLSRYLEAAATNSYTKFWPLFFEAWFKLNKATVAQLPNMEEDDSSEESASDGGDSGEPPNSKRLAKEEKRKALIIHLRGLSPAARMGWQVQQGLIKDHKRLKTWFRWRQTALTNDRKGKGKTALNTGKILKNFLHTKDSGRLHSITNKYSKLYYDTRVAPLVAIQVQLLGHKPSPAENLAIIKRLTRETWENEDDETIAEVNAALDTDRAAKLATGSCEDGEERTPAEYQRSIGDLPAVLKAVFEELSLKTGWSFTVLMGGPYPQDGGSIQTASHHVGLSPFGNDFEKAYPEFQSKVVQPFYEFLRFVYPKEVRCARGLQTDGVIETDSSTVAAFSTSTPLPTTTQEDMVMGERPETVQQEIGIDESRLGCEAGDGALRDVPSLHGMSPGQFLNEQLEFGSDPFADMGMTTEDGHLFSKSLMPLPGDYPFACSTVDSASGLPTPMILDDELRTPSSFDHEEFEPYVFDTTRMLPPRSASESPSPSARRRFLLPATSHSPVTISSLVSNAAASTTRTPCFYPPATTPSMSSTATSTTHTPRFHFPATIPSLLSGAAIPSTPTHRIHFLGAIPSLLPNTATALTPRKLVVYSTNTPASQPVVEASPAALKLLASQSAIEAMRDEGVDARRAVFAQHGQLSKTGSIPLESPTRADESHTTSAEAGRETSVKTARAVRIAAAAQLNALAMKRAEFVAAQATAKRESDSRLVLEARANAAATVHKQKETAALAKLLDTEKQPTQKAAAIVATEKGPTGPPAAKVTAGKVLSTAECEKENRKNEAKERKLRAAEKRRLAAETTQKKLVEADARIQKIADVAALSAAAKVAAAPAGDVNGLTPECPQWMHDAVDHLRSNDALGLEWAACVKAWVLLEIAAGFADTGSHGNAERPDEIRVWIKTHRLFEKPPPYHKGFGASCISWWMHLQPAWRTNDGDVPYAVYACGEGDWGALRKTGKNGLFMVLLAMSWWVSGAGKVPPVWTKLVVDITHVLASMAAAPQGEPAASGGKKLKAGSLKRKHPADNAVCTQSADKRNRRD